MNSSLSSPAGIALPKRWVAGIVLAALSFVSVAAQGGEPVIRKTLAESTPGTAPAPLVAYGAPNHHQAYNRWQRNPRESKLVN